MSQSKILLIRTDKSIIQQGYVGIGWGRVDFSQYNDVNDLLKDLGDVGKSRKNIKRFFNLKQGDIVLVPLHRSVGIGVVSGHKRFSPEDRKIKGCNQISVDFFCSDETGKVIQIPRNELKQELASRLKIRQTIAELDDFSEEILGIIDGLKQKGGYQSNHVFSEHEEAQIEKFKHELLKAITSGNTWLSAGGKGLEKLIAELLKIEGYEAHIQATNQSSDIADVDIKAFKSDRFYTSNLLIQAKHHSGVSSSHGLNQLIAYPNDDDDTQKWLITTANVSDETLQKAEAHQINVMQGADLVEWIYENLNQLSPATKQKLGIIEIPQLITFK